MDFNYPCTNGHRLFVAETGHDASGHIVVILVCTTCGAPLKHEFTVEASGDGVSRDFRLKPKKENN